MPFFIYFVPHLGDPDDELILELAIASGSRYVVTHNRDHFRDASRFGIRVVSPGDFLSII
jgi:predicted nucleic acid-binding protein